jgi:hypothetical protein
MITPEKYQTYKKLPSLAGVVTHSQASKPGLSIDACTTRLKRFHYCFKRLHEIFVARITAEPIYELKVAFAHHGYLCAEHVNAIRDRVAEMREPPLGLEIVPDPNLERFFDEIRAAVSTEELLVGLYEKAIPALESVLTRYRQQTNPLTDAPSVRVIRFALLELEDIKDFGAKAVACLVDEPTHSKMGAWLQLLDRAVQGAGDLDGVATVADAIVEAHYSAKPYVYDPIPKRDERFQDLFNQGVNAEAFIYDETLPAKPKSLMMLYKRIREIDVPEMMASIITETKGKPWGYYLDMTRQLWDEARHAMMGEVGFTALGVDWTKAKITYNWSYRLNTECTPMERHGVLFFIEQGLMTKTGKRYEWEVAQDTGIPLMATIQDFDWADEVLHASIGREWYITQFENLRAALDYGDKAWSKILSNWQQVKDQGLTQHENWWPAIYAQACEAWQQPPENQVLNFATTYEGKRADMKDVGMNASA